MFIRNHVLAGTAVGLIFRKHPVAGFVAGVASHFLLDAIPHWGVDSKREDAEAHFLSMAKKDGVIGLGMAGIGVLASPNKTAAASSIFGSVLPDLEHVTKYFFNKKIFPRSFQRFHGRIQDEAESRLRQENLTIVVGSLLMALALWMVRRAKH